MMSNIESILVQFPLLKELEYKELVYQGKTHPSLAAAVVNANLPYKPGVYLVYDYSENKLGKLLYVGKAGANKEGEINAHQIPKRLLAVCYPPKKYLKKIKSKHPSRNDGWPIMMEVDNISSIKIFCFFSKIGKDFKVLMEHNPLELENQIRNNLTDKPEWAKRK